MKVRGTLFLSLFWTACLFCMAEMAFSQGTHLGTIRGTVTDPQGAVVAGAQVQVTDMETNLSRNLMTDGEGNYEATNLKFGRYRVSVTAQGFKTFVMQNIFLRGSDTVRADARLEVGGVDEQVTVSAEAGIIQTENQTVGSYLDQKQLAELPRDSRDIYQFLYLSPSITQAEADGTFKFIGTLSYGAAFSLDGQRSNSGVFGVPTTSQPSLEAVGEMIVLSNNFTAEYAGIANIRVQTRRGAKDYHGSLFYNNKNSALAAWTIREKNDLATFVPTLARPDFPKPYFNLNETGGMLSGPVPFIGRGKTFFLVAYERRWMVNPARFAATNSVPGQRLLSADFSQLTDANKPAVPAEVLPLLTPAEMASNTVLVGTTLRFTTIPQRLLNPTVAQLIKNYFPVSNPNAPVDSRGRLLDFAQNLTARATRDLVTARVDHDFSPNDKFYGVYNYQNNPRRSTQFAGAGFPAFGLLINEHETQTLSLSYTRVFSSTLINEARGGFNSQNSFRRSARTLRQFLSSINFSEADIAAYGAVVGPAVLDTFGQTALTIGPYARITNGGRSVNRTLDQKLVTFGDTLTWIKGRHSIKVGFDLVRNRATDGFVANSGNPRGLITYSGSNADPFARFLLGLPPSSVSFVAALRGPLDVSNWEHGYFIQDDFKVHPRLTLNLGLRYELITPFVEQNNLLVNFDPDFVDPATGRRGRFIVPTAVVIPQIDPRMVAYGVVTADEVGLPRGLVRADRNNFAPRLGIAWRVTDRTVLRGGYGIFYPTPAAQGIRDALGSAPFNQARTKRHTLATPLGGFPGGLTNPGLTPFSGGSLAAFGNQPATNAIPFDLQQPRIEQFNVTFERELGWHTGVRVSYLGTRMHGLIAGSDLNLLPPSDRPFGTTIGDGVTPCDPDAGDCAESPADIARRPFPELATSLTSYGNFGRGRSHALQIEISRRFAGGLTFNASYTLLDQKVSGLDTGNSSLGGTAYNQFNPEKDFGRDTFTSRHRFVAYGVYELPFGRGRRFGSSVPRVVEHLAGGWQLSWNMFAKSGTGFTPFYECGNCGPVFPGNIGSGFLDAVGAFEGTSFRANTVPGVNPYSRSGDSFFNAAAFAPPSTGADLLDNTNVAMRNSLTGPSVWGVNLGIRKFFQLTEAIRLDVGVDLDNAFNHPLRSPLDLQFANLGTFFVGVDQATARLKPITRVDPNQNFGRIRESFGQEGIDSRRTIRLKLRLTF